MNAESSNPAREERVYLDSVKNVECSVPVVRVLAEIKVNRAEDATESNIAMKRRYEKPGAEEVSRDEARNLVPNFGGRRWAAGTIEKCV